MADEPRDLEEQRRRGLELQAAVPKPSWPHPASLRSEEPEREDLARKGCVTFDHAGAWGFFIATAAAIGALTRRMLRRTFGRDRRRT